MKVEEGFFDGYGNPVPTEQVIATLEEYVPFRLAALQICPNWSSNNLHRKKQLGKVDRSKMLYVVSQQLANVYPSTKGRKAFLHIDEIERLKKIYGSYVLNNTLICGWCRRFISKCAKRPCKYRSDINLEYGRLREEFNQTTST